MTQDEIIRLIEITLIEPYPPGEKDYRPMSKQEWGRLRNGLGYVGVPRAFTRLHAMHARHLGTTLIQKIKESDGS